MYITSTVLLSMMGSLVLLLAACGYLYLLYRRAMHSKKHHHDPTTDEIIARANQKAQHIIDQAVEHSQETLYQTDFLKAELVKHGEQSLQEVVNHIVELLQRDGVKYDNDYKTLFETIQKEYVAKTQEVVMQMQQQAQKELGEFHETVRSGTIGSQKALDAEVEKEFAKAQTEIAAYRDAQFKKVDSQITAMVGKVVEQVIGQVIPLETHEKLILDALASAKQDGMFGTHIVQSEAKPVQPEVPQPENKTNEAA